MNDTKKFEKALKEIEDAMDKLQIPRLSFKPFNVSAFEGNIQAAKERDELVHKLEELSGRSLEELVALFAAGWILTPAEMIKFDGIEFVKSWGEEEINRMRRAGYFNAGERVIPPLQINFEQLNNPPKGSIDARDRFFGMQ